MNVFAAVTLPPPVHGQAIVNAEIVRRLEETCPHLQVMDIGPGPRQLRLYYHLRRILQILKAVWRLPQLPSQNGRCFYTSFEAGLGIVYNFVLVGFARWLNYRIVIHHHTSAHTLHYSRLFQLLTVVGGPEVIHAVLSGRMAMDLKSRYPRVIQTIVCNNASYFPVSKQHRAKRTADRALVMGILSNLSLEKGLDTFLETLIAVRTAGLNVRGILGGPLIGKRSLALVERMRPLLGTALEVKGPLYGEAKAAFFRSIDVFFFPTQYAYEAQPLVIFEALSFGVPVISSDRGYIAEMLGAAGIAISQKDNLLTTMMNTLRTFSEAPEKLTAESEACIAQFSSMHQRAKGELKTLLAIVTGDS